jgi:two-component system sensor histidine kinase DesK
MGPLLGDGDAEAWMWSLLACAVFVPIYFAAYWVHGWRRIVLATLIAGIGAALAPYNASASSFFIYAAYFAGSAMPRAAGGVAALAWISALFAATAVFVQPLVYFWAPGACGMLVIGMLGVQHVARANDLAHLRLAREEIDALARIAERERIALDLHDLLGHSLSIIALKSELAQRVLASDPARARRELDDVQEVAREALAEVRVAVRGYRVGSGAGLRYEIDNAERALESAGVVLVRDGDPMLVARTLDAAREGALALALREAVTNVVRHARASRCEVVFFDDGRSYGVAITDDGRGGQGRPGHGLAGMRARVEALGGRLDHSSGHGTRLRIAFQHPDPEATLQTHEVMS